MKKQVFLFIFVTLAILTIVPAINIFSNQQATFNNTKNWLNKSTLYNIDFLMPTISRFFYPFGISTNPDQVIIGKNEWLYLGDVYSETITKSRLQESSKDKELNEKIVLASNEWNLWLKNRGVKLYKIILGPNKNTIYPEFFPSWAQTANNSASDSLIAKANKAIYVDTRSELLKAKSNHSHPLYYKTDSHWNSLGAWIAFRTFTKQLSKTEKNLKWLSDKQITVLNTIDRPGGDLSKFLRMNKILQDSETPIRVNKPRQIEIEQFDFESGHLLASNDNPKISTTQHPMLIKSKEALNQKKVLWLHDSFGNSMSPFMEATFSEILTVHYRAVDSTSFARLVEVYKPDYVFMTVVERDIHDIWFTQSPPITINFGKPKNFISLVNGYRSGINDLYKLNDSNFYKIIGADPYMTFTLQKPVATNVVSKLVFDLNCGEHSTPIQAQLFWRPAHLPFNENSSIHLNVIPGTSSITLATIRSWTQVDKITDVRIDIDSPRTCPTVKINQVELGKDFN